MTDPAAAATRYTTIDGEHRHELEVRRSRFITVLRRTETEDCARSLVAELRKEFHDARHHCSAFVLGPDRGLQRSNDDGEPSGTAGTPMLEALIRRETAPGVSDLSDVAAVVVRYFGGILLGAGGLVRAYSDAVSRTLDTAPLLARQRMRLFAVPVGHGGAGRLEHELRAAGLTLLPAEYGAGGVMLRVALPDEAAALQDFHARLASLTSGGPAAEPCGTEWVDRG